MKPGRPLAICLLLATLLPPGANTLRCLQAQSAPVQPPPIQTAKAEPTPVARPARQLDEAELTELLTDGLQRRVTHDRGELELRLGRPWTPLSVPAEGLSLRFTELPPNGIAPTFVARFELLVGTQLLGSWQTVFRAKLFRDVVVTRAALRRGQPIQVSDFAVERRDVLQGRETLSELPASISGLELVESLPAGAPVTARSLQLSPVVRRGELVEALVVDGSMSISLKVEALENGAPGQTVRVRNLTTRKEFRGKVRDEQTILVSL